MKLDEIKASNLQFVSPHDSLVKARRLMIASRLRHLLVVDNGRLVGLLTERDVALLQECRGESIYGDFAEKVSVAMIRRPQTASPEDEVAKAAVRMAKARIGCLPVVENEAPLGLVNTWDVLATYPGGGIAPDEDRRSLEHERQNRLEDALKTLLSVLMPRARLVKVMRPLAAGDYGLREGLSEPVRFVARAVDGRLHELGIRTVSITEPFG